MSKFLTVLVLLLIFSIGILPAQQQYESPGHTPGRGISPGRSGEFRGFVLKSDLLSGICGLLAENPFISLALELPMRNGCRFEIAPAAVYGGAEGAIYVQASLALKVKRRFSSTAGDSLDGGFYLGTGLHAAWMRMEGSSLLAGLGAGLLLEGGFRFFPFSLPFMIEPHLGAGFLAGPRSSGASPRWNINCGIWSGVSLGYRF